MSNEPVFVGIDPGTTAGIAVVDCTGTVRSVESAKNFSKHKIIRAIIAAGAPMIIGTDKAATPSLISEIAGNLGAAIETPTTDLGAAEKRDLIETTGADPGDDHAGDALAAAVYAYRQHEDKISQIKHRLADAGHNEAFPALVPRVLVDGESIGAVIRDLDAGTASDDAETAEQTGRSHDPDYERIAASRADRINLLEAKVANLQEYIGQIEAAEPEPSGVDESALRERNREIRELRAQRDKAQARAERLKDENERLAAAIEKLQQGWRFVPAYTDISAIDADIAYLESVTGEVPDVVDAIITDGHVPSYSGVRAVRRTEIEHIKLPDGLVIPPETFSGDRGKDFSEWLQSYQKRRSGV